MNYLMFNGVKIELTAEQAEKIKGGIMSEVNTELFNIKAGGTCKIGDWEFIVCEHTDEGTVLLLKDCLYSSEVFGENNNYNGSNIDELCEKFADELVTVVGKENIITHTVDLTANDGLRDYGTIERRVSVFTANQCRKYVDILDEYSTDKWLWTATAYSTPKHHNDAWVLCVAPSGYFGSDNFNGDNAVRPFCILKSNIFVSDKE